MPRGSGWTCNGTSCTRSDELAANTSYPAITVTMNVAANASTVVTNTAAVSGDGETNTSNDTASDATTVLSSGSTGTLVSIFSASSIPANPLYILGGVTVGTKFRSDVSGTVTARRFYKGAGNNGTHIGLLYSESGTLLAQATYMGEAASGWQQVNLSTPVTIAANTTYTVAYFTTTGFAYDANYFRNQGVDNAPLHAPTERSGRAERGIRVRQFAAVPESGRADGKFLGGFSVHCGRRDKLKPQRRSEGNGCTRALDRSGDYDIAALL